MSSASVCCVEVAPKGLGQSDYRLIAKVRIRKGTVVLREAPWLVCGTTLTTTYAKLVSLTETQLQFMSTLTANRYALSDKDEADIDELLAERKAEHMKSRLQWMVAVMRCNGHGLGSSTAFWALYKMGLRADHSCDPNVLYRNSDGFLSYVALRDIEAGESVLMSYVDCLYSSRIHRQEKLLKQKLFVCECVKCNKEVDPCRRIWCPHCRTTENGDLGADDGDENAPKKPSKVVPAFATFVGPASGLKNLPQFQMTKQMNQKYADEDSWWLCTKCGMTYNNAVLPVAVESTLTSLFKRLDGGFAQPDAQTWYSYLNYLYQTSMTVLGSLHWLTAACNFLLSRFYVGLWNGGNPDGAVIQLALKHGNFFIDFVEAVAPEAVDVDVTSWASVLMRMSLSAGDDPNSFIKLAVRYLPRLRILYGPSDNTVKAYEDAISFLHQSVSTPNLFDRETVTKELKRLATVSIRSVPAFEVRDEKFCQAANLSKEDIDVMDEDWLAANLSKLEKKQARSQKLPFKPWEKQPLVPEAFLKLAKATINLRTSEPTPCSKGCDHPVSQSQLSPPEKRGLTEPAKGATGPPASSQTVDDIVAEVTEKSIKALSGELLSKVSKEELDRLIKGAVTEALEARAQESSKSATADAAVSAPNNNHTSSKSITAPSEDGCKQESLNNAKRKHRSKHHHSKRSRSCANGESGRRNRRSSSHGFSRDGISPHRSHGASTHAASVESRIGHQNPSYEAKSASLQQQQSSTLTLNRSMQKGTASFQAEGMRHMFSQTSGGGGSRGPNPLDPATRSQAASSSQPRAMLAAGAYAARSKEESNATMMHFQENVLSPRSQANVRRMPEKRSLTMMTKVQQQSSVPQMAQNPLLAAQRRSHPGGGGGGTQVLGPSQLLLRSATPPVLAMSARCAMTTIDRQDVGRAHVDMMAYKFSPTSSFSPSTRFTGNGTVRSLPEVSPSLMNTLPTVVTNVATQGIFSSRVKETEKPPTREQQHQSSAAVGNNNRDRAKQQHLLANRRI